MAARVLVDTNVFIYIAKKTERGRRYSNLLEGSTGVIPFVAAAELLLNARRTRNRTTTEEYWRERFRSFPVVWLDLETCGLWAELMARAHQQGVPSQDNDVWIAACALQHNLPLLTHNPRHFEHLAGLRIIHDPDPD